MKLVDTYVIGLLNDLNSILDAQQKILKDEDELSKFKKLVSESLGDIKIG